MLVRESPHQLDDATAYSFVRHDEGLNMRLPVFSYEAWILFLAFPPDYLNEHYVNKVVSLFGKLILWHRPNESNSRVLVRVLLKNTTLVPHSIVVTRVPTLARHGMSWVVPVCIPNGREARLGLIDTEEPAPPLNASPHPLSLPYLTAMQQHHLDLERFNQQQVDARWAGAPTTHRQDGCGEWPAVPQVYRGISMRTLYGYDGPSMMDGVESSDISSEDPLDAWHEHVMGVEQAADDLLQGVVTGDLTCVRAGGMDNLMVIPPFGCFLAFLG